MAKYQVSVDGNPYEVEIVRDDGKRAVVKVDGREYTVDAQNVSAATTPGGPVAGPTLVAPPPRRAPSTPLGSGDAGQVLAPLAGLVLEVCVSIGQSVAAGDAVVRLEAMKMENDIKANSAGSVAQILVSQGDEVQEGQTLVVLEA